MFRQKINSKFLSSLLLSGCFVFFSVEAKAQNSQGHSTPKPRLFGSFDVKETKKERPRVVEKTSEETKTEPKKAVEKTPVVFVSTSEEQKLLNLINKKRETQGFSPLVLDKELCRLARVHSENMVKNNFVSHVTPEGKNIKERAKDFGIKFKAIGENIAFNQGYEDPVGFAVERWLVSYGHKQNIFQSLWTGTGIGIAKSEDGGYYFTQVFISR